jgi:hypothetical protein
MGLLRTCPSSTAEARNHRLALTRSINSSAPAPEPGEKIFSTNAVGATATGRPVGAGGDAEVELGFPFLADAFEGE